MRSTIHILDAITVALSFFVLASLSRKWMKWSVPSVTFIFAVLWYLHSWHSDWLGSFPAVVVDCSTFGLAFLGGHVALNPPTRVALKRLYVTSFVFLAVVGVIANVWQRNIEKEKQDKAQIAQTNAEIRFSADLKTVKDSNDAILKFVANPPKGITREQMASFVEALTRNRATKQNGEAGSYLNQLSNESLSHATKLVVTQLLELAQEWEAEDRNAYLIAYEPHYFTPRPPQSELDERMETMERENAKRAVKYREQAKDTVVFANDLRKQILQRLIPTQRDKSDDMENSAFEQLLKADYTLRGLKAEMSYLSSLEKRFSKM